MSRAAVIAVLARAFLAGEPADTAVLARAQRALGRSWPWLAPLVARYFAAFAGRTRPRHRDAVRFLRQDAPFHRALKQHGLRINIVEWVPEPQRTQPAPAARTWALPKIETMADLADWLCLSVPELEWFADLKELGNKLRRPQLEHYRYRLLPKRSGGVRLVEMPRPWLKALQRRILSGILDHVPLHAAAHGFAKGRSIVTFAAPHVGRPALLRLDLEDFFPSFCGARVQAFFRTLGYPETVADLLGGICTNAAPRELAARCGDAQDLYRRPHLPQGAPASPALANLMAYRLDCRLAGLAQSAGATYTRYADDLAFSGGDVLRRRAQSFAAHSSAIALEEGFSVNHRKTRVMHQGVRQQLAGIVVNAKISVPRCDIKSLEAILTNCARFGPASQNRAGRSDFCSHLEGRVGFIEMVDQTWGRYLRRLFDAISW